MAIDRLMRANRTILAVPVVDGPTGPRLVSPTGTTCPLTTPTATVLNPWIGVVTTATAGASWGGNISCALLDDVTLGLADSDTDDELTICSIGNEVVPTFYNVDAQLTALRDRNIADTGVFNMTTNLFNAPDLRFAFVDRLESPSQTPIVATDIVSIYEAKTDNPVDIKEDRGNLKIQQNPVSTGIVAVNVAVAA